MLKLKHMNKIEKNGPEQDNLEDPSKRLLGKAAVATVVAGALVGTGINRYIEEEKLNDLYSSFKGQEKNFEKAKEAAEMLIEEMDKAGITRVKLIGEHPNNRIEILRTFLTSHIDSPIGNRYPFKNSLIISGYYTKENLEAIIKRTALFTDKTKWK